MNESFSPYQQKVVYQIYPDSSDDEDCVKDYLNQLEQPYLTVTRINYQEFLKHVNLEELTRRSDILVMSTMSLNFFPRDYRMIS